MFSRSTTTTTTTTTTMILVVRKFCFYLNEDVALRSHLYFFFYLIFHRSNTKKLTAMRTRTTTIKVASSFTVVVRCVLSNEDALCVCVVQKHKNPFFSRYFNFFLIHRGKKIRLFFSLFLLLFSCLLHKNVKSVTVLERDTHTTKEVTDIKRRINNNVSRCK